MIAATLEERRKCAVDGPSVVGRTLPFCRELPEPGNCQRGRNRSGRTGRSPFRWPLGRTDEG